MMSFPVGMEVAFQLAVAGGRVMVASNVFMFLFFSLAEQCRTSARNSHALQRTPLDGFFGARNRV